MWYNQRRGKIWTNRKSGSRQMCVFPWGVKVKCLILPEGTESSTKGSCPCHLTRLLAPEP